MFQFLFMINVTHKLIYIILHLKNNNQKKKKKYTFNYIIYNYLFIINIHFVIDKKNVIHTH